MKRDSTTEDRLREMQQPLTPRGDMRLSGRIAPVAIPDRGCPSNKCIRPGGHSGRCWPDD